MLATMQIPVGTGVSFECHSQEECRQKCKDHGGVWKEDKTGATLGTCTARSVGGLRGIKDFLAPANLPAVLVVAGAGFVIGGLVGRATRAGRVFGG